MIYFLLYSAITSQKKVDFLHDRKKLAFIENAIQKTANLEVLLKEWYSHYSPSILEYIKNASNLNKRMMSMLIERFKSQVQLFDKPAR
jgi:hypothetical protein